MAWRSNDYEPPGGWTPPDWLAPWAIWLFGAAFFAAVILLALRMLPGDATWWMILASICAGSALAAAVVKPWRG